MTNNQLTTGCTFLLKKNLNLNLKKTQQKRGKKRKQTHKKIDKKQKKTKHIKTNKTKKIINLLLAVFPELFQLMFLWTTVHRGAGIAKNIDNRIDKLKLKCLS
jgi:hypothetical protein